MKANLSKIASLAAGVLLALALAGCAEDPAINNGGDALNGGYFAGPQCSLNGDTVRIGEQVWQKCNLNVEPRAGTSVCYNNEPENCAKYGRLYDWEAANAVCPTGWHLPSSEEWDALLIFVDNEKGDKGTESYWCPDACYDSETAGRYLKATNGWDDYYGGSDGGFHNAGVDGRWWSSSENGRNAYNRRMNYYYNNADWLYGSKNSLFSVRCLKDDPSSPSVGGDPGSSSSFADIDIGRSGTFTDARDRIVYKWVEIGRQTWMAENLNYDEKGSKCYNDDPELCAIYGRLYDWKTATRSCPSDWHLPSDAEWTMLTDFVGFPAGPKLNAINGWKDNNTNGTDEYGFAALPGGLWWNGNFEYVGEYYYWWSSSQYGSYHAHYRDMYYFNVGTYWNGGKPDEKSNFYSVRCVKD